MKEFQSAPAPPWNIFSPFKRKATPEDRPVDRFALPDIPAGWNPDNVSVQEKRKDIIETAKSTAGFPKADGLYYTSEEIAAIKRRKARDFNRTEIARARSVVEHLTGRPYDKISHHDLRGLQDVLNIDPWMERVRPGAAAGASGAGAVTMSGGLGDGPGTADGPARPGALQKRKATTTDPAPTARKRARTATQTAARSNVPPKRKATAAAPAAMASKRQKTARAETQAQANVEHVTDHTQGVGLYEYGRRGRGDAEF